MRELIYVVRCRAHTGIRAEITRVHVRVNQQGWFIRHDPKRVCKVVGDK